MLRVMLVDDEPLALEGLKLLIDWRAEGFEVCAECASGAEALARADATRPDLIVTDIRMPGLDGLELMHTLLKRGFTGQFIVVSGYNDFEYAKRAMRCGVAGYLLKPIEPDEAAQVLEHVRRKLIDREAGDAERRVPAQRAVTALLAGYGAPEGAVPAGNAWRLATWGAPLPYGAAQEVVDAFPEGAASTHIVEDKEFLALRWPAAGGEPAWGAAEAALKRHHRRPVKSERTEDPARLAALRGRLASQLDAAACSLTERVTILTRAVALRQADECRARCAELESFCAACGADALARARQQLVSECARQFADRPEQLETFLASQDDGLERLCLLAVRLLTPAQARISDRMIGYVQEHGGEKLTIESVAAALTYNATYLGRVFREEQGEGFREWLANWRVERAAGLLTETEEAVCRVAEQVGYRQYKRFLKHFKRRYGLTPEQYRRQNGKGR